MACSKSAVKVSLLSFSWSKGQADLPGDQGDVPGGRDTAEGLKVLVQVKHGKGSSMVSRMEVGDGAGKFVWS